MSDEATKKVTLYLEGEGFRIDLLDEDGGIVDCYNEGFYDGIIYSLTVIDENGETEVDPEEITESIEPFDDEENKYDWGENIDLSEAEDMEDVDSIHGIQTKVAGEVVIEIPADETFDIKKAKWMVKEVVLPDSEEPYAIGIIYNDKSYPVELIIDSEKEVDDIELWSR